MLCWRNANIYPNQKWRWDFFQRPNRAPNRDGKWPARAPRKTKRGRLRCSPTASLTVLPALSFVSRQSTALASGVASPRSRQKLIALTGASGDLCSVNLWAAIKHENVSELPRCGKLSVSMKSRSCKTMIVNGLASEWCESRHANSAGEQYEQDFIPHRLCNWEIPAVKVRLAACCHVHWLVRFQPTWPKLAQSLRLWQRCALQKTSAASMYGTLNSCKESTVAIADNKGHLLSKKSKFSDSFNHDIHVYDTSAARWPKVRGCIVELPQRLCHASLGLSVCKLLLCLCSRTL